MRIALFSDVHGNSLALDAVLADVQRRGGVDGYWVLGDIVALGPDPIGVLRRLAALPGARFIRGNTDRYVVAGDRPPPTLADAAADARLLPGLVEVAGTFAWTQGAVTAGGWLDWLAALPVQLRATLPDGTRVLAVHSTPDSDDGPGLNADLCPAELDLLLAGCDADLVCGGHTHWVMDECVGERRVVNVGSLSNPLAPDLRAGYVLLEAGPAGYGLEYRRVDYDREAVIAELERLRHPGADFVIAHQRGERWRRPGPGAPAPGEGPVGDAVGREQSPGSRQARRDG